MPVINHKSITETPWRLNYKKWDITKSDDGTVNSHLSFSIVGTDSGAPLHTHDTDELIVVLKGELKARIGDTIYLISQDHTLVIPPNTPHEFTNTGSDYAHILEFFPTSNPLKHTKYLEGSSPDTNTK